MLLSTDVEPGAVCLLLDFKVVPHPINNTERQESFFKIHLTNSVAL